MRSNVHALVLGVAIVAAAARIAFVGDGFDANAWRLEVGNYAGRNVRGGMVAALGARLPPGTSRPTVRVLLGDPDFSDDGQDIYTLGRSAMGPHFETCAILYDGAGRIIELRRRRI